MPDYFPSLVVLLPDVWNSINQHAHFPLSYSLLGSYREFVPVRQATSTRSIRGWVKYALMFLLFEKATSPIEYSSRHGAQHGVQRLASIASIRASLPGSPVYISRRPRPSLSPARSLLFVSAVLLALSSLCTQFFTYQLSLSSHFIISIFLLSCLSFGK